MKIKKGKEANHATWVTNNTDPYGSAVIRYATHWANMMEKAFNQGQTLASVAKELSHACDTEGVTGFMYGCAVGFLSQCWEHGEELRRWHNVDTQIGNEGEVANEAGGVLNPALLSVQCAGSSNSEKE